MKKSRYQEAVARLESSREFPERLGTGKPDDPDYRIQDHLEIFCYEKLGLTAKAEEARVRIKAWASRHPGSTAEVETQCVEEWYRTTLTAQPELKALQALAGLIQNAPEKGPE